MSAIRERIERFGSIRFDEYVELALYAPGQGFFATGGGAGRAGADFVTSPEVGPLFGAVVGRWLDRRWHELGRPDPFVVVEAAAGRGALAISVLHARPECASALRYVLVERSEELRARQGEHLAMSHPFEALGPEHDPDVDPPDRPVVGRGQGPIVCALEDLPAAAVDGVVIANELLDNVAFRLLERSEQGWDEVRVTEHDGELVELLVPADDDAVRTADQLVPDAPVGARVPLQREAGEWLRRALDTVRRGSVLVIDYAASSAELATRPQDEWLRTYRAHDRGGPALVAPGSQDITCEVAVDQLERIAPAGSRMAQADWLAAHGIEELVEDGRAVWAAAAGAPDLAAVRARSRITEAEALRDPTGLGAFAVLEWQRP
ncbi:MAG: SAM-dependent methyltransferase [Microthrixaceae bacterium]